jgi:hypothetical protein
MSSGRPDFSACASSTCSEARPAIDVLSVIFRRIVTKNLDMADYIRPLFRHKLSKIQDMADYEGLHSLARTSSELPSTFCAYRAGLCK